MRMNPRTKPLMIALAALLPVLGIAACTPAPTAAVPVVSDKTYPITPASVKVSAGSLSGEVTELKVTERVEEGSGRIAVPAKLSGKLVLKNTSADQTVRIVGGRFTYVDAQGQAIKLEEGRAEPMLKMTTSYNAPDRLDPGQESSQLVEVEFPAEALKAKKLHDIRLQVAYIPSPFREQAMNFGVSVGGQ